MRNLNDLDQFRVGAGDADNGAFVIPSPCDNDALRVIASTGGGWDHVSVSLRHRTPTWDEMEAIKRRFFLPTETAMQLHVPETEHKNVHPYCLHLWRPHITPIPRPPAMMV